MTETHATRRTRPSKIRLLTVLGLFAIAAAVGAYFDWYLWHPASGIMITLAAAGALIVALVLWLVRARLARWLALGALAIGVGLIAGQILGPSRPTTNLHEDGVIVLHLQGDTPVERTGKSMCRTVPAGDQLSVSNDANDGRSSDLDAFIGVSLSIGDMWDFQNPGARADHLSVFLLIESAIVPEDGKPSGSRLLSDPASTLAVELRGNDGTIQFANLVGADDATGQLTGERSALTGTIEWTCGGVLG